MVRPAIPNTWRTSSTPSGIAPPPAPRPRSRTGAAPWSTSARSPTAPRGRLDFDPVTGRFPGCDEANRLLGKAYREPYGLPDDLMPSSHNEGQAMALSQSTPQPHVRRVARVWVLSILAPGAAGVAFADDPAKPAWKYSADLMRPFWRGTVMEGESVLFIRDDQTGEGACLGPLPDPELLAVRNSPGDVTYKEGRDYVWKPGSREIVLPTGSRIVASTPAVLRRPPKTQKYELTHRDGNGEIFFGARLEYHELQTCITYAHAPDLWTSPVPTFDPKALPSHGPQAVEPATREDRGAGRQHLGRLQRFGLGRGGPVPACISRTRAPPSRGTLSGPGRSSRTSRSAGWIPTGRWVDSRKESRRDRPFLL